MSGKLAIVLPGREYTALGACIRVPLLALTQLGFTIREIDYPDEPRDQFDEKTADRIAAAATGEQWAKTVVVAKSLGTGVVARIGDLLELPQPSAIWLTPLFKGRQIRDGAVRLGWPSLLVSGTADEAHDPVAFDHVATKLGADTLLIDGADHGLEVPGDVAATVDGFARLAQATLDFAA